MPGRTSSGEFRFFLCEISLIYKPAMPENQGEDSTQVVSMMSSCHDSSTKQESLCSGRDKQLNRNWEPRFRSLFLYKTRPSPEWRENTHIDWPLSSDVLWCCVNLEFWERKTLAKVYDSLVRTRLCLSWNWSTVEGRLGKMAKCQIGQKPSLPGLQQMEVARCSRRPTGRGPWRWTSGKHQIRHFTPTKVTTKPTPQWTLKPRTLSPRQGQSPLHIAAASGASNSAETKFDMSVFNAVSSLCVNSCCWLLAPPWALSIHQMPRFGGEVWDVWLVWCTNRMFLWHLKACGCWLWRVLTQRPRQAIDGFCETTWRAGHFSKESFALQDAHGRTQGPQDVWFLQNPSFWSMFRRFIACKTLQKSSLRPLQYAQQRGDVEVPSVCLPWMRCLEPCCRYLSSLSSCLGRLLKAFLWVRHWKQPLGAWKWNSTPWT